MVLTDTHMRTYTLICVLSLRQESDTVPGERVVDVSACATANHPEFSAERLR